MLSIQFKISFQSSNGAKWGLGGILLVVNTETSTIVRHSFTQYN